MRSNCEKNQKNNFVDLFAGNRNISNYHFGKLSSEKTNFLISNKAKWANR
ncbi:hypothetical protein [endosymbiont GvMRE of Glomus versiforme]|nr:hypothetical protein [endosymbiont GvMRE of Glomus versiforme]